MAMSWVANSYVDLIRTLNSYPLTLSAVGEHNSTDTNGALVSLDVGATDSSWAIYFRGDLSGDPVAVRRVVTGGTNSPQVPGYAANTPYRITMVARADNDVDLYMGNAIANSTVSDGFPTGNSLRCNGHFGDVGTVGRGQGYALWAAELTPAEIASLVAGYSPRRIRPQALVNYMPAVRELQDLIKGGTLSLVGSATPTPHLRTYGM